MISSTYTELLSFLICFHFVAANGRAVHLLKPGSKRRRTQVEAASQLNYTAFFRLFLEAPGHSQYLLSTFADRERFEALRRSCRVYQPSLAVDFIAKNLAFDGADACADWMEDHGASLDDGRRMLDCKTSRPLLVEHSIAQKLEEVSA